jgi:hypothetical protein
MKKSIEVYGDRGTSQAQAASILTNGFQSSDNDYDWLGTGVYFFQDAPLRAEQWARERHPENPAVICAIIRLENCIDLLDIKWVPHLKNVYNLFVDRYESSNQALPEQNPDRSKAHLKNTELYQQAKKESKLEIAPKLLKKGLSIQEVAEILELDVRLIA